MLLGRVVGSVWATAKNPNLEGQRLLIVQPLTPELTKTGRRVICTDATGAGVGGSANRCDIPTHHCGDVARTDLFPANDGHLGGFDHGVSGLDHGHQTARLNHS